MERTDKLTKPTIAPSRLKPPRLRFDVLRREQLLERIRPKFENAKLLYVCAPAGYGKSTFLVTVAEDVAKCPYVWLSLGPDDALAELVAGIVAAVARIDPSFGALTMQTLQNPASGVHAPLRIATILGDELAEIEQLPLLIIVDDLHHLHDQESLTFLTELIKALPEDVKLALGTRTRIELPFALLKSRRQLLEVGLEDLNFSLEETGEFVRRTMGEGADLQDVERLHQKTGGWPAALSLATYGSDEPTLSQAELAEYLDQEVLAMLPADEQDLLVRTSVLRYFDARRSSILLDRKVSSETLRRIFDKNRFVDQIDPLLGVYRVHDLFRDFLLGRFERLPKEDADEVVRRAARTADDPLEALTMLARRNLWADFKRTLDQSAMDLLRNGQSAALLQRLERVPSEIRERSGVILYYMGRILTDRMQLLSARQYLERAWKVCESSGNDEYLERTIAILARISWAFPDLRRFVPLALDYELPDETRLGVLMTHGWDQLQRGMSVEAHRTFIQADNIAIATADIDMPHAMTHGFIGDFEVLDQSPFYATRVLNVMKDRIGDSKLNPAQVQLQLFEGFIHYFNGEWPKAAQAWERTLELCDLFGGMPYQVADLAPRLPLIHAMNGDFSAAEKLIESVEQTFYSDLDPAQFPLPCREFFLFTGFRVQYLQGQIPKAQAWLQRLRQEPISNDLRDPAIRMAEGYLHLEKKDYAKAKEAFEYVLERQRSYLILSVLGDARLLLAYIALQQGDKARAVELTLEAAHVEIDHGRTGRLMLVGRQILGALVALLESEGKLPPELRMYAVACTEEAVASKKVFVPGSSEALTQREVEVLELIASGASNKEIADKLFISPFTVKRHVTNLLLKMNVGSRTKAAAAARELIGAAK